MRKLFMIASPPPDLHPCKEMEKDPLVPKLQPRSKCRKVTMLLICLLTTSVILLLIFILNAFANSSDPARFGFPNGTANISDEYSTEITPSGWTFRIWIVIYAWQAVWVLYGWSFVFRPRHYSTIYLIVYPVYTLANLFSIGWLYLWSNDYPQYAFPCLFLVNFVLWCTIAIEVFYLYKFALLTPNENLRSFKIDYYLTQIIVVNGLLIYAVWTTIAALINLTIVLQYFGDYNATDVATAALALLAVELIVYFILENTVFDRFLRFSFLVYPVVIWALSGMLSQNYQDDSNERNGIFSLVVLIVAMVLFVIRIVLWIVFLFFRRTASMRLSAYGERA